MDTEYEEPRKGEKGTLEHIDVSVLGQSVVS